MKLVFAGGGTAGHIFPIVAITQEMRRLYPSSELKIYYLGPGYDYGDVLLSREKVAIKHIVSGKLRRYFSWRNVSDVFKVPVGFLQAFCKLFVVSPDVVFSSGGFGAFPVILGAFILRIPIVMHEPDTVAGLVSRITAKFAAQIFSAFPDVEKLPKEKTICVGNPIRPGLSGGSPEKAKEIFSLQNGRPIVLILGGSQGSQSINNLILEILPQLTNSLEVIHQTGFSNEQETAKQANFTLDKEQKKFYHCYGFLNSEQLKHAFAACNLIISRAGSGALFEIASAGKPSILIPLQKSAQNHQAKNSYWFQAKGACEVVEEQNLKPNIFLQRLFNLINSEKALAKMAENAAGLAKPQAAAIIAKYLIDCLKNG
ncbi:MAG: UDP-N-acetylglucosamine--N-acetylmuramyl-(pentapeptide) pyrophosphoryl-undecaprenol N-acetylglucosamine transferase [Patescibacteria group bacterium]|nr:UDP-N-acetylglucosamine--N-acetylmuramyl-(pentapeptide) pyrophosphoryl-undecaprenol N-acetylglucosamine transferase [Patescibacteria group bacterium]